MFLNALALSLAASPCRSLDTTLPAALTAWATPGHGNPADLSKPVVLMSRDPEALARDDEAKILPPESISAMMALLRSEEPAQRGGAASIGITIDRAGIYSIALDQGAHVQMRLGDAPALPPFSTVAGPECSSIVRIARFALKPGVYSLELSVLEKPKVKVMLAGS